MAATEGTYGLKYTALMGRQFGQSAEVHLLEEGYTGAAQDLRFDAQEPSGGFLHLTDDPLSLTWGRRGADLHTPVLGSRAQVNFHKVGATELLAELGGAPIGRYRMEVLLEGERYWEGQVITDTYEGSTMTAPSRLTVEAIDGTGLLENVPYADPGEDGARTAKREGRISFARALAFILQQTGSALPLRAAVDLAPFSMANPTGGVLNNLSFDQEVFFDEEDGPASCDTVLRSMLYLLGGARLFQEAGSWHVVRRKLLARTAGYQRHVFNAEGLYTDLEAVDGPQGVDLAAGPVARLAGRFSFRPALASASITYAHGPIPPLLLEGGFGEAQSAEELQPGFVIPNYSGPWQTTGQKNYFGEFPEFRAYIRTREPAYSLKYDGRNSTRFIENGRYRADRVLAVKSDFIHGGKDPGDGSDVDLDDPDAVRHYVAEWHASGYQFSDRTVEPGQIVGFNAELFIQHNEGEGKGLFPAFWRLQAGPYALTASGTWTLTQEPEDTEAYLRSALDVQHFVPPQEAKFGKYGVPLDKTNTLSIVSAPLPDTAFSAGGAPLFVQFWGTVDKDGERLDPGEALWDNIDVRIVRADGKAPEETTTTVSVPGVPEPKREEVEVFIGTGPARFHPSRLTTQGEDGERVTAEQWAETMDGAYPEGAEEGDVTLEELTASLWLQAQAQPVERRSETYEGLHTPGVSGAEAPYSLTRALAFSERPEALFTPIEREFKVYSGVDRLELDRLLYPEVTLTTGIQETESGGFVPASGGTSAARDARLEGTALDLTALEDRATTLEAEQAQQRIDIDAAEADIAALLGDVSDLEAADATQDDTLADHEGRISDLEAGEGSAPAGSSEVRTGTVTVASGQATATADVGEGASLELQHVQLTPLDFLTERYRIASASGQTFDVELDAAAAADRAFAWMVVIAAVGEAGSLTTSEQGGTVTARWQDGTAGQMQTTEDAGTVTINWNDT